MHSVGVMVEAAPAASLVVTKPDFLLEFLIVALNAPAQLGKIDEPREADVPPAASRASNLVGSASLRATRSAAIPDAASPGPACYVRHERVHARSARDSQSAEPSRHFTVRQARFGKTKQRPPWPRSDQAGHDRPVLFSGLPLRLGPFGSPHQGVRQNAGRVSTPNSVMPARSRESLP